MVAELNQTIEMLSDLDGRIAQLGPELQTYLLMEVAGRVRDNIADQASQNLDTTLGDYLQALTPVELEGDVARIALRDSTIANMLEQGATSFEMRDHLLQGRPFRRIRFQSTWPESAGRRTPGGGRPVDRPYRDLLGRREATRIGRSILRELKSGRSRTIGAGRVPLLRQHHATDLFHRMRREDQSTRTGRKAVSGSEYAIYRTVSMNSTGGWVHPGLEARDFFGNAREKIGEISKAAIDGFMGGMFR